MGFTLLGLLLLSQAPQLRACSWSAAALVGIGSSVFHPESSRVARMASGGRHGFAQSLFQVGGNAGSAIGPLLAAFIVVPRGQGSIAWFSIAALLGDRDLLCDVGALVQGATAPRRRQGGACRARARRRLPRRTVVVLDRGAARADLLEVLLHGEPDAATTRST